MQNKKIGNVNTKKTKFIFVFGGVMSSLGKGIIASSIGCILTDMGYNVINQKLDPYLNVDPGTLSPYQHGEVYVTKDGAETDLDLGNYERFLRKDLNKLSTVTSGKIYFELIENERKGKYLGETLQFIPHVTNLIRKKIFDVSEQLNPDFLIIEIGGTVGDIESVPFIESIRQIISEIPDRILCILCAPVIKLNATGELKTKPLQHSVRELKNLGIVSNFIVLRSSDPISKSIRNKISFMCDVNENNIFVSQDLDSIYFLPEFLFKQNIYNAIVNHFKISSKTKSNLSTWKTFTNKIKKTELSKNTVRICLVGKYTELHDSYLSVCETLKFAGYENNVNVEIEWVNSRKINEQELKTVLKKCDGLLVPGGFGIDGVENKIKAIQFARVNKIPFLGLCLGMQLACIEFARNVLGWKSANSIEFVKNTNYPIFHLINKDESKIGGTLRLGDYEVTIVKNTMAHKFYKKEIVLKRHRHRYEFNNIYLKDFINSGFIFSGYYKENNSQEIVEIKDHPFFMACQYHPEFGSKPLDPDPLFLNFITAAKKQRNKD